MRAAGRRPTRSRSCPATSTRRRCSSDVDEFDAEFFGFSARDAALTDPQHRLFLETAGRRSRTPATTRRRYPGAIGRVRRLRAEHLPVPALPQPRDALGYLDGMQLMVTNDKDHLCTQVSYRLNLRGPERRRADDVLDVARRGRRWRARACRRGRCDMALAGGVTVRVPQRGGYFYTPGSILSPDGHCRPFDAERAGHDRRERRRPRRAEAARGRARRRRQHPRGHPRRRASTTTAATRSATRRRASAGRPRRSAAAQALAGVSPETIGYVEAHGTGTILGDPIELSALTEAFRAHTDRRGFCGIGSVKSNFGHLSCAAGVAGLIKTVLVLEHGAIPPTVALSTRRIRRSTSPRSPFYVTTTLEPWERNGVPRRAGVSSFGVGGTNAHVVVEEAPASAGAGRAAPAPGSSCCRRAAKRRSTLRRRGWPTTCERHPELDLADVAFTLHVGRRAFRHRRVLVARATIGRR